MILGCPRPKYFFSGLPLNPSRHQAGRTFHPSLKEKKGSLGQYEKKKKIDSGLSKA
jgi:hypothetical protein